MSKASLTKGPVASSLFKLTAPMILAISANFVVQALEVGFIGQLSTNHLAALTFTFPITMILMSVALGISIGTSSVVARSIGGGDHSEASRLGTHSLILVSVVTLVLALLGINTIDPVFRALGAPAKLMPLIHSYMIIAYPGAVLFTVTMVAGNIMRASGNATVPGVIMTLGAAVHLALAPVLIFGWLGLPRMELAGAATAMLLSRVMTSSSLLVCVYRGGLVRTGRILPGLGDSARQILHIGLPAMATQLIVPVSATVITRLLAGHGEMVIAGFGVAIRIESLAVMTMFALSGSIGPFIGQNWAAGHRDRAHQGLRVAYQFCLCWGLATAILLSLFGGLFASWIDDNPVVVATAAFYLALVPWSYGPWGVLMMASASFNALGKPLPSTALSFTRMFFINIPLALLLNHYFAYQGIFVATVVTNLLLGIAGYFWFRQRFLAPDNPRPVGVQ